MAERGSHEARMFEAVDKDSGSLQAELMVSTKKLVGLISGFCVGIRGLIGDHAVIDQGAETKRRKYVVHVCCPNYMVTCFYTILPTYMCVLYILCINICYGR